MMTSGWMIPLWILGAPLVAVILSLFLFQGRSSMGSGAERPRMQA
jgi:hypothetical protein